MVQEKKENKKEGRAPDFVGEGASVWLNVDKDGNQYVAIQIKLFGTTIHAFPLPFYGAPDFVGEGASVWLNVDKDGNQYVAIQIKLFGTTIHAFPLPKKGVFKDEQTIDVNPTDDKAHN